MIKCDLCKNDIYDIYLSGIVPDVWLCSTCSRLSAAEVVYSFISKNWPNCEKCKKYCRSGKCDCEKMKFDKNNQ